MYYRKEKINRSKNANSLVATYSLLSKAIASSCIARVFILSTYFVGLLGEIQSPFLLTEILVWRIVAPWNWSSLFQAFALLPYWLYYGSSPSIIPCCIWAWTEGSKCRHPAPEQPSHSLLSFHIRINSLSITTSTNIGGHLRTQKLIEVVEEALLVLLVGWGDFGPAPKG